MTSLDGGPKPIGEGPKYLEGKIDSNDSVSIENCHLAAAVEHFFPQNNIEGSIDWCIARCLEYKPEDRIIAEQLQPRAF